jgi:hypothetical protein
MFAGQFFDSPLAAREFLEEANEQATMVQWRESRRCALRTKHINDQEAMAVAPRIKKIVEDRNDDYSQGA